MPDDVGALTVAAGAFGMLSASTLIFLLTQAIRGFWPNLGGRAAVIVVYLEALLVTLIILSQSGDAWAWDDDTFWVAVLIGTLSLGIVAQGIYSSLFKVSVSGLPPSPDAEVPADAVRERDEESL